MPDLTLSFTTAHANRAAAAYGRILGLERDATLAEIKDYFRTQIIRQVKDSEKLVAVVAVAEPSEIAVT